MNVFVIFSLCMGSLVRDGDSLSTNFPSKIYFVQNIFCAKYILCKKKNKFLEYICAHGFVAIATTNLILVLPKQTFTDLSRFEYVGFFL